MFAFDIYPRPAQDYSKLVQNVCMQGLDPDKNYRIKEINLMSGQNSSLQGNDQIYSGDYLMKVGLGVFTGNQLNSRVIEITAEN